MNNDNYSKEMMKALENISKNINKSNDQLESLKSIKCVTNFCLFFLIIATMGINFSLHKKNHLETCNKAVILNEDNALIVDITSLDDGFFDCENCSVVYVDESKGVSANDIAVSLVGEDGEVYYYNYETKQKVLIKE